MFQFSLMEISVLASGSGGNAVYLAATPDNGLLIDAGISCRDLQARLARLGRSLSSIRAILLTHDHTDHCKGLPVLFKNIPRVKIFATEPTAEAVEWACACTGFPWQIFDPATTFNAAGFSIQPVQLPHDAADPLAYIVSTHVARVCVATDLGHAPPHLVASLANCHAVVLEFNHDEQLLKNSGRPGHLIRRISSPRGHLSNTAAAELLERILTPRTRRVYLAHLSRECNTASLALAAAKNALVRAGRLDIELIIADQDQPTALFSLS